MYIQKIETENFRIYKDRTGIEFLPDPERNVFLVSGYNGFGKTTFLTSLVWCLYGKNMQEVDDIFQVKISEAGGYASYLNSSMNRLARIEGATSYSVSMTIVNADIPGIKTNEIIIKRSYQLGQRTDNLEIFIDGHENELIQEIGNDLFIQDFVLPKEIAKFFFFDAEKITAIAEIRSIAEKRRLSKAYSEVLGIKKYEDLRENISNLRLRFRKDSASKEDRKRIRDLEKELNSLSSVSLEKEQKLEEIKDEIYWKQHKSNQLQEKLIREGSSITLEELQELRERKEVLTKEYQELKAKFKDVLDLAPFAMTASLFFKVGKQVETERADSLKETLSPNDVTKAIHKMEQELSGKWADKPALEVIAEAKRLMESYLLPTVDKNEAEGNEKTLHDMEEQRYNEFQAIANNLKSSYRITLKELNHRIKRNRSEWNSVKSKLSQAESREQDRLVQNHRDEKAKVDASIKRLQEELQTTSMEIGSLQNDINARKAKLKELEKKVQVSVDYVEKDIVAERLLSEVSEFIARIREEKRELLEARIKKGLNTLMHKSDFVHQVSMRIDEDMMDIELYNSRGERIEKEDLSMGEKQLYATAILQALVQESNIEFPIFIDSPMQKLDVSHAENIISEFYPNISKQVVVLPLIGKELSEAEYELLKDRVKATFIIKNLSDDASTIVEVPRGELFNHVQAIA